MTAQQPGFEPRQPSIIELASRPEVDPCDVACDAMPGYILGDLNQLETSWVLEHTENCRYCQAMLEGYQDIDSALATCCDSPLEKEGAVTIPPSAAKVLGLREARYGYMDTELGPLLIVTTDNGVCEISYLENTSVNDALRRVESRGIMASEHQSFVQPVVEQLSEYFAHKRTQFFLPIDLYGVSPFTRSVLEATNHVPCGTVVTYGQIAEGIGQPGASRAVGNALGRNPVPIVVPCHRVIKSDGSMGWYTGGPHLKQQLLDIEGVHFRSPRRVDQQVLEI
jgi:methylated-DNA-[protein]-cysteine S-methyltransferase